jgi:hypothetical protein
VEGPDQDEQTRDKVPVQPRLVCLRREHEDVVRNRPYGLL